MNSKMNQNIENTTMDIDIEVQIDQQNMNAGKPQLFQVYLDKLSQVPTGNSTTTTTATTTTPTAAAAPAAAAAAAAAEEIAAIPPPPFPLHEPVMGSLYKAKKLNFLNAVGLDESKRNLSPPDFIPLQQPTCCLYHQKLLNPDIFAGQYMVIYQNLSKLLAANHKKLQPNEIEKESLIMSESLNILCEKIQHWIQLKRIEHEPDNERDSMTVSKFNQNVAPWLKAKKKLPTQSVDKQTQNEVIDDHLSKMMGKLMVNSALREVFPKPVAKETNISGISSSERRRGKAVKRLQFTTLER